MHPYMMVKSGGMPVFPQIYFFLKNFLHTKPALAELADICLTVASSVLTFCSRSSIVESLSLFCTTKRSTLCCVALNKPLSTSCFTALSSYMKCEKCTLEKHPGLRGCTFESLLNITELSNADHMHCSYLSIKLFEQYLLSLNRCSSQNIRDLN